MSTQHDGPQSPLIREKLALARSGSCSTQTKRRRKTSYVILLLDAVILVAIFAWVRSGSTPEPAYSSTSIFWKGAEIRLSAVERQSEVLTTLSISTGERGLNLATDSGSLAQLLLSAGNRRCTKSAGPGISMLNMGPNESRSFVISCTPDELGLQPRSVNHSPWRFFSKERGLPLTVSATINTPDRITLKLDTYIKGAENASTP